MSDHTKKSNQISIMTNFDYHLVLLMWNIHFADLPVNLKPTRSNYNPMVPFALCPLPPPPYYAVHPPFCFDISCSACLQIICILLEDTEKRTSAVRCCSCYWSRASEWRRWSSSCSRRIYGERPLTPPSISSVIPSRLGALLDGDIALHWRSH